MALADTAPCPAGHHGAGVFYRGRTGKPNARSCRVCNKLHRRLKRRARRLVATEAHIHFAPQSHEGARSEPVPGRRHRSRAARVRHLRARDRSVHRALSHGEDANPG